MTSSWKKLILAAAVALGTASAASADSFENIQILGSTTGVAGSYTSNLVVTQGETVYYEVFAEINQTTATNSQHPYTLVQPQISGTDGINSTVFDLTSGSETFNGSGTLQNGFGTALGTTGGTASGTNLAQIDASQASGTFVGATSSIEVLSGTFTAGSSASDTVSGAFSSNTGSVGGIKVDTTAGQKGLQVNYASETSSDHYVSYTGLTLTEAGDVSAVPAPSMISGFGVLAAGLGVLGLRRRARLA